MKGVNAAIAGAFVSALAFGGIGAAVGADTTLYACEHNRAHTIKMTTAAKTCPTGWTKISWNTAGPKGDTGLAGPKGDTGPAGTQGAAGPTPNIYAVSTSGLKQSLAAFEVYCNSGDTATGGGAESSGNNIAVSAPILDGSAKPIGWRAQFIHSIQATVTVLCLHLP